MRVLLEELSAVREIIGTRPTYVKGFPRSYQGLIYFLLDANPAPHLFDTTMLRLNDTLHKEAIAYYATHVAATKCLISAALNAPEVILFQRAYPDARVYERQIGKKTYRVYVAPDESAAVQESSRAASFAK